MKRKQGLKAKQALRQVPEVPIPVPTVYNGEKCRGCGFHTMAPYSVSIATARQCQNPACRYVEERVLPKTS